MSLKDSWRDHRNAGVCQRFKNKVGDKISFDKKKSNDFVNLTLNLFLHLKMKQIISNFIIRGGRHENPIQNTNVIYRIFPKEMILNKYFLEKIYTKIIIKHW